MKENLKPTNKYNKYMQILYFIILFHQCTWVSLSVTKKTGDGTAAVTDLKLIALTSRPIASSSCSVKVNFSGQDFDCGHRSTYSHQVRIFTAEVLTSL